jgi:hypothetical protein
MKINDMNSEYLRAARTQPVRPVGQEQQQQPQPRPEQGGTAAPRADKVQISRRRPCAGRAGHRRGRRSHRRALAGARQRAAPAVLERRLQLRQMVDEVARRILERGDV